MSLNEDIARAKGWQRLPHSEMVSLPMNPAGSTHCFRAWWKTEEGEHRTTIPDYSHDPAETVKLLEELARNNPPRLEWYDDLGYLLSDAEDACWEHDPDLKVAVAKFWLAWDRETKREKP